MIKFQNRLTKLSDFGGVKMVEEGEKGLEQVGQGQGQDRNEISMKDRLRVLIGRLNLSQKDFAVGAEIEISTISRIYSGAVKSLSVETIARIVLKYHVSPLWLILGAGDMFLPDNYLAKSSKIMEEAWVLSDSEVFMVTTLRELPKPKREEILRFFQFSTGKNFEEFAKTLFERRSALENVSKDKEKLLYLDKENFKKKTLSKKGEQKGKIQIINRTFLAPYLGLIPAGKPLPVHIPTTETRPISADFLTPGDKPRDFYCLTIKGESMKDLGIYHNDLIAIKKRETAESGEIVVALIDDEATLKEYIRHYDSVELRPHNRSMKSIFFKAGDSQILRIQGVLVGIMRPTN